MRAVVLALGLLLGRAAAQTYSCPDEGQRSSSDDCWALGGLGARRQACECPLCPAGRHANGGAYDSACTFCRRGSFRAAETLGGCAACGVGQSSDEGAASCSWTTELVVAVSVAALGLCMAAKQGRSRGCGPVMPCGYLSLTRGLLSTSENSIL